jgi:predicted  nucleic acid-binding Zn-ribbon protein
MFREPVMKGSVVVGSLLCAAVLVGCDNRSEQLEKEVARLEAEKSTLQKSMTERDTYFDEVMNEINTLYKELEATRSTEARLVERAEGAEGVQDGSSIQAQQTLIKQVSEVRATLQDNRKQISRLESRLRSANSQMAGLNALVKNLKQTLEERERSIAQLNERVNGLETAVAEKARQVLEKEDVIRTKDRQLNTAYYVVGTRRELEERGIITEQGGFLWGLLGSTTVMSSGVDQSLFSPLDRGLDTTIHVEGSVREIIPKRNNQFYALVRNGGDRSDLTISDPERFWQDKYLVIVVD